MYNELKKQSQHFLVAWFKTRTAGDFIILSSHEREMINVSKMQQSPAKRDLRAIGL
jgi:hypothetical protein